MNCHRLRLLSEMSNVEKNKAAADGKSAEADDEPDEWSVAEPVASMGDGLADSIDRDKRIFSTGCAGSC